MCANYIHIKQDLSISYLLRVVNGTKLYNNGGAGITRLLQNLTSKSFILKIGKRHLNEPCMKLRFYIPIYIVFELSANVQYNVHIYCTYLINVFVYDFCYYVRNIV
jgi:hypothetical protein